MRAELPSGGWLDYRPYDDVKGKDKKRLGILTRLRIPVMADGRSDLVGMSDVQKVELDDFVKDAAWALMVTGWSFDELPLPQVADNEVLHAASFGELPVDDYTLVDALLGPHVRALVRQPDPKGHPTATTSSSNGSSRAKATSSRKV